MSQTQLPPNVSSARRTAPPPAPLPQEDRRRSLLAAGLWALAVLVFTLASYRQFFAQPSGAGVLTGGDAIDYAQIARNMANGHGFATGILRPLAVTGFAGPDRYGTAPDVSHAPLYPFVLMLTFMAHSGHGGDTLVVALSLVLFLLSVLAAYRLARTFFPAPGQVWIALLSAGLYGIGGEALGGALGGGPVMLATLLVTVLLIALHGAAEAPGRPAGFGGALWVGFLLGLCYLTQYSLLLLAPPVLVYLFFSRAPARAWAGALACVLGFLLAAGPWMIRNAVVGHGDPLFTLLFYGVMADTPDFPGATTIYRSVVPPVGPLAYFYTHLPLMLVKTGRGLVFYRDHLLQVFNVFLLAAATASLFWRAPDVRVNAIRAVAVAGLLGIVVASSVFQPAVQMVAPFAPLVAVAAAGFVFSLVAQQDWDPLVRRTALWGLGLLIGLGSLGQFVGQKPVPAAAITQGMQSLSNAGLRSIENPKHLPGDAMISDAPWEIAWRSGVTAIWLPANNAAYQATRGAAARAGITTRCLLLTPEINLYANDDPGEASAWVQLAGHPAAYEDYLKQQEQFAAAAALIGKHDPRVTYTLAQVNQARSQTDAAFATNFGPISDIMADYQATPSTQEPDSLSPSTLFLPRAAPTGLR